ncbi:uncharacterized protein PAE49_018460 [Odontesthes bonariensis]
MNTVLTQVESQMEDNPVQRRGSRAYQIFPEASSNEDSDLPEGFLYRRERLPSIVVEPTEYNEQENGEACQRLIPSKVGKELEEEEEDPTEGSDEGTQESLVAQKPSVGQSQGQLFRLTPPASPTIPEAAPPCLRS